MAKNILITGTSSGIGLALAQAALSRGEHVFGLQRRSSPLAGSDRFTEISHDLTDFEGTPARLAALLGQVRTLDLVILNAGMLGNIADLSETPLAEIRQVMDTNTWGNKALLDALFGFQLEVTQVVGLSSGAATSGNRGWSSYALSKAAFLMLLQLYAAERPDTHFCSFAPGLVDTAMQDYLCALPTESAARFPSVGKIQSRRGTADMPKADVAAARFLKAFSRLREEPSGAFVDIRKWDKAPGR